jgi:putative membrane protein
MSAKLALSLAALLASTSLTLADPPDQPGHISPQPNTQNNTVSAVKDTAGHAVGTVSAEMTTKLQDFVTAAAVSDMYEVEAAKIAEQRSHDAQVRAFAHKMIGAHTQTTDELKATLTKINATATPPGALDDRRQGMIDELRGAKDADFDNRYMAQQVDAHNEALTLMDRYAKDGDTPAVKSFAAKTKVAVQEHLDMAKKLFNKHNS